MVPPAPGPRGRAPRRRAAPIILALLLPAAAPAPALARQTGADDLAPRLERVGRSVALIRPERGEQGDHRRRWLTWRVEYRLRNAGRSALVVEPGTISCTVEGWASNSRADGHGLPRRADHALGSDAGLESLTPLIEDEDPTRACAERATLQVWPDRDPAPPEPTSGASCAPPDSALLVPPGETLRTRILLEHCHHLHGPAEPLLGDRELTLRVGPASFRDEVTLGLDDEPDRPIDRLGPIPDERRDGRVYYSAPDSLYLDAALPGFRTFQFRDLQVPRDADMRLRFRYLRSLDSTGSARVELKQYQDVPNAYRVLTEAKHVEPLGTLGTWVAVEHRFRSDPRATTMQLKILLDCEGDGPAALWVDDIELEPVEGPAEGP